jgi:hypothetical protein
MKKQRHHVNDQTTTDLEPTQETVFQVIALNPETTLKEIDHKYSLKTERIIETTDQLQQMELIEQLEDEEENDLNWKVTELGQTMLLKLHYNTRFTVMQAKLRGQPKKDVKKLRQKKKAFKTAYRQSKTLFQ